MKLRVCFVSLALAVAVSVSAQNVSVSWKTDRIDGSRTGVKASNASNVTESMGYVKGCSYHAPNGKVFRKGIVKNVAELMLDAQPAMAQVKQVIGYSTRLMERKYPECELYDWLIDELMRATQDSVGRKVDIGLVNRGGVRIDMPQGDVFYDDIMSMFPFKNNLCYLSIYGRDVRAILEQMAATTTQVLGGVRIVIKNGKLLSATVGGEPLDDDKLYGLATINFLLDGGDGFKLSTRAKEIIRCNGYVNTTMIPYVQSLTAEGKPIEYQMDGRIRILKEGETL